MANKKISFQELRKFKYVNKGELARITGIKLSTIKCYSNLKLLQYYIGNPNNILTKHAPSKERGKRGLNRYYHLEDTIVRLKEIKNLKKRGIKLWAMKKFLTKDMSCTSG